MNDEIEATFRKVDKDGVRTKLQQVGARLLKPEFLQKRVVFNLPKQESSMPEMPKIESSDGLDYVVFDSGKKVKVSNGTNAKQILETIFSTDIRSRVNKGWLRIRDEATRITMTYKRQDSSLIDGMREIEVIVDDFDAAFELLTYLGCKYKAYQETRRELWELNGVEVTIDEWPYLEPFVEVEGHSEGEVKEVSHMLGFEWETAHFGAVDTLYSEKYGVTEKQINEETPEILFDKPNPFIKIQ